jgi:hypothetical protein
MFLGFKVNINIKKDKMEEDGGSHRILVSS